MEGRPTGFTHRTRIGTSVEQYTHILRIAPLRSENQRRHFCRIPLVDAEAAAGDGDRLPAAENRSLDSATPIATVRPLLDVPT